MRIRRSTIQRHITLKRLQNISVIILTKNEEKGISQTLSNLNLFDDVVVVDSNSTDATPEIVNQSGVRLVNFSWDGNYPKKKQWALENCNVKNDWVLLLDADEYPSRSLLLELEQLQSTLATSKFGAFDINLSYKFSGKFLRFGHKVTKRSLLHRGRAVFPEIGDLGAPGIREVEGHYQPIVSAEVGKLKGSLIHDDKDPVSSWFERHNRYSDWEAYLRRSRALRLSVASKRTLKGRIFDRVPFKPLMFFVYSYLLRFGFLDGKAGFDYAFCLSFYYWQISLKVRELERVLPSNPRLNMENEK